MQSYKENELPENPRETANPISALMFCFTMPTFFKGRKKVLQESDLYRALKEHKSDFVGHKLSEAWEKECAHGKYHNNRPNLLKATLRVFGYHFFLMGFITLITEIVKISQPLFLGKLVASFTITNLSNDTIINRSMDINASYLYAGGVILTCIFSVVAAHPNVLGIAHSGMKVRVALCSLIYRKALRLSKAALSHSSTGQMVNLISNDVGRLDTSILHTHYLWVGPLEVIIVTYLMFLEIGVSAIFGVALLLLFVPLQMFLGKKISTLRLRTAVKTDERVRLMNEIVNGIQVIKMYAWEMPFAKMVEYCRRKEMNAILYANYIRGVMNSFLMFVSRLTIFASLVGYVLFGQFLTAEKAFIITAYCNLLRLSMTVFFPLGITQIAETLVSFKRIQKFLLLEEIHTIKSSKMVNMKNINNNLRVPITEDIEKYDMFSVAKNQKGPSSIVIKNFIAKWIKANSEYTLDKINLNVQSKTLVAVIGPVGSGKSSLIQAILGELPAYSGNIEINGIVSYAAQDPWLFTGTVRQNILFGLPLDKYRYQLTIKKCALERDFNLLPNGDKTIVGERGTSLSGGQKARINLARAVYRQADIYLFDDPLSAVDTHIARHLFDHCIRDYLRNEIVILVTHQLQFVERADLIVIMDKGKISAAGTYATISQSGLNFAQLLQQSNDDNENDDDETSKIMPEGRRSLKLRKTSISSFHSKTDIADNEMPMQPQEERKEGKISLKLYHQYFKASGGYFLVVIWIIVCLLTQIFVSGADYYLSFWATKYERGENDSTDIYIFTGLNMGVIFLTQIRTILFFILAMRSSINLHNNMFMSLTRTAMYFFHMNPSGRILNRFSKDMGQVDEILPAVLIDVIQIFLQLLGIIVVLCMVNPWYVTITIIMGVAFYFLRNFYLQTSRDVKRLEAITRSPIYSHLAASLNGLATIRAFGAQDILIAEFDNYQDLHSSTFYMFLTTSRAFGYWMDWSCVLYIILVTISFFIFGAENGGDVGLAITQAMGMTGMVQWGMRQSAELENTMTSVERVIEYGTIPSEGEFHSANDKKPQKSWPQNGHIVFANLSLSYTPEPTNTERVLKSLNFEIKSGEKIGIVGRTGAGKSSLINALFRLSYIEGKIIIDDRVTEELGLHDLRRKISIIPQEPVLFSGTMRFNLDPFDEFNDDKLWDCLEEVKLKQLIADMPQGLLSLISEGGANFSVGQRQLICLARAILRENRILVLDEATANVDPQTDALIQTTIRKKFKNCTVLTIAHRLNTIMDSDKVLVMDEGRAVEYDIPYKLLTESPLQIFHGMVKQTGINNYENLLHIAQNAFEEKYNECNTRL